jgi:hypothetical protein
MIHLALKGLLELTEKQPGRRPPVEGFHESPEQPE